MRSLLLFVLVVIASAASAQTPTSASRERARIHYRLGWEHMRVEHWSDAAKEFDEAIAIDPEFEFPHYGLGRARLAMKRYVEAIASFERCRAILQAQAGRQFANARDAQRYREDRLRELDEQIRFEQSVRPQSGSGQSSTMRGLQLSRQNVQESIRRGTDMTIDSTVPAWLTLSLGSAYFRAGRLADAEREYKAAVAVDPKAGEAHSNLAVVYLETERYKEALAAVDAAKRAGFRVHPDLEREIRDRLKH